MYESSYLLSLPLGVLITSCISPFFMASTICGRPSDTPPIPFEDSSTYPNPIVEAPPNMGFAFVAGTMLPLDNYGYEQAEYFYSGTANSYVNTAEMNSDGKWEVAPKESAPYKTRMLIYRPTDPGRFTCNSIAFGMYDILSKSGEKVLFVFYHTGLHKGDSAEELPPEKRYHPPQWLEKGVPSMVKTLARQAQTMGRDWSRP